MESATATACQGCVKLLELCVLAGVWRACCIDVVLFCCCMWRVLAGVWYRWDAAWAWCGCVETLDRLLLLVLALMSLCIRLWQAAAGSYHG